MEDFKNIETLILSDEFTFQKFLFEFAEKVRKQHQILPEYVDEKECMRILNIKSKTTLQKYRDTGKITFSKMGKIILYKRSSLFEFIKEHEQLKF